jgi:GTP pyrophosphokinase
LLAENSSPPVEGNFDRHSLRRSRLQWSETDRVGKRRTASATRHTEARCKAAKIARSRPIVLDRFAPAINSFVTRLKDHTHLTDKLKRRWDKLHEAGKPFDVTPENLNNKINDLVGGRILHLHTQQFPSIHAVITDVFGKMNWPILRGGAEAKVWDPEYKQLFSKLNIRCVSKLSFYTSVHYEFKVPGRKPQLTCELQVRSLAEELWGETEHLINYPTKCEIESVREQILVLARATSTCTRLVDSIMKTFDAG